MFPRSARCALIAGEIKITYGADNRPQWPSAGSCTYFSGCTCEWTRRARWTQREAEPDQCLSWEFFTSLSFDWDFISGKKKFRWPLVSAISVGDVFPLAEPAIDLLFRWAILPSVRADRHVSCPGP